MKNATGAKIIITDSVLVVVASVAIVLKPLRVVSVKMLTVNADVKMVLLEELVTDALLVIGITLAKVAFVSIYFG